MITGGVAKYVELLMDAGCYTKEKMLNYVCRQDSYFLSEGRDLMNQEFSEESTTYFSVLQLIKCCKRRSTPFRIRISVNTTSCSVASQ